jgi:hypothetical protein
VKFSEDRDVASAQKLHDVARTAHRECAGRVEGVWHLRSAPSIGTFDPRQLAHPSHSIAHPPPGHLSPIEGIEGVGIEGVWHLRRGTFAAQTRCPQDRRCLAPSTAILRLRPISLV